MDAEKSELPTMLAGRQDSVVMMDSNLVIARNL